MPVIAVKWLRICLLVFLLAGCIGPVPQGEIADLHQLPQDAGYYVDSTVADRPLLTGAQQDAAAQRFLEKYFRPWNNDGRPLPAEKAFAPLYALADHPVYGANLLPYTEVEKERLAWLCDVARYPGPALRAVTVRDTHLRALPTQRPGFADPARAGEGFPFDYFQYSAVRADTPLRIVHRSADGAWYLVETLDASGWLPVPDVALVDKDFVARFQSARFIAVVQEGVPLIDGAGHFRQSASIGSVLPLAGNSEQDWRVLIAVADRQGRACIQEVLLPEAAGAPWPLPATPGNMAILINRLLGQPYGWGGLYGDRDCSSTLQDLFAAVGMALPRNSASQIESGRPVSLEGLAPEQKEQALLAQGEPFMTLLGTKGHVLLYLGRHDGRAVVLHTQWGLRTRSAAGGEGRHRVGRTVITSLQPGRELPHLARPEGDLRWRINAISFLPGAEKQAKR